MGDVMADSKNRMVTFFEGIWEKEMHHPAPVFHRNLDGGRTHRVPYSINISP